MLYLTFINRKNYDAELLYIHGPNETKEDVQKARTDRGRVIWEGEGINSLDVNIAIVLPHGLSLPHELKADEQVAPTHVINGPYGPEAIIGDKFIFPKALLD